MQLSSDKNDNMQDSPKSPYFSCKFFGNGIDVSRPSVRNDRFHFQSKSLK